ncbi:MAG TPA: zf-HC2 domain-containing protein [Gemmatimonadales bacterium]|nr:zf-HC2 domain-containing protein [Gemmatimonadales bacterium]
MIGAGPGPRVLTCREVLRCLPGYVDGETLPGEARRLRAHLAECPECRRRYRFERAFVDVVRGRLENVAMPAGLRAKIGVIVSSGPGGAPGTRGLPGAF